MLSPVKTAANHQRTPYFDLNLLKSPSKCQRLVWSEPKHRNQLKDLEMSKQPVEIHGGHVAPSKRNAADMDYII